MSKAKPISSLSRRQFLKGVCTGVAGSIAATKVVKALAGSHLGPEAERVSGFGRGPEKLKTNYTDRGRSLWKKLLQTAISS